MMKFEKIFYITAYVSFKYSRYIFELMKNVLEYFPSHSRLKQCQRANQTKRGSQANIIESIQRLIFIFLIIKTHITLL